MKCLYFVKFEDVYNGHTYVYWWLKSSNERVKKFIDGVE